MEQVKTAERGKINKPIGNKVEPIAALNTDVATAMDKYGLKLTLDNSLKKFANDPFIIEHNNKVNKKFAKHKSD
jgi:hypothetical protein